jgi:hypothetical protein
MRPEVEEYANRLLQSGMEEREAARAALYAEKYGLESLSRGNDCVVFDEPSCGNWNCLNPEHQCLMAK